LGPANNGIGFGRRRNQSRGSSLGGSADFANEGFDDISVDGGSSDAGSGDEEATVDVVEKTSVCFFSVGFDASIAMQFHQLRERTPCCADNVAKIVAGHAVLGFAEAFAARKYLRPGVISLRVDGEAVAIPPGARTLQFFNIHSSATGIDFFGTGEPSEPTELQRFEPPCIGDGLIEVVATMSAWHLGAIRLGFGHSHRVAQGASVEVILREALPVQVDGEPWLQPPAVVHVSSGGKIPFVIGRGETRNVPEMAHVRVRSVDIPEEDTGARATSGTTSARE
jgi:diacylglycerol kinase (ATP)